MIYLKLFFVFFKISLFTFGGGYAMLPLIQEEVISLGWIEHETLINFIAISESTPGPFAINLSTYIGFEMGGLFGAICSTLGIVLPSFIIILIITKFYKKFRKNGIVRNIMNGLNPCVVGLIASSAISLSLAVFIPNGLSISLLKDLNLYISIAIFLLSILLSFKKVNPILIICISAIIGIFFGYLM